LPERLRVLYYFVRPFRLLFGRHKGTSAAN
jgi:hypothetical protein